MRMIKFHYCDSSVFPLLGFAAVLLLMPSPPARADVYWNVQ